MVLRKLIVFVLLVLPTFSVFADVPAGQLEAEKQGKFAVKSDHRSFNPFNLSYTLKGNVEAKFPNRHGFVVIRADKAVAHFLSQKITATGNVELNFKEITLRCDRSIIKNKEKKAYLYDNVYFKTNVDTISSKECRLDYRQMIANFVEASRNGQPVTGNIVYEVTKQNPA